jgi:hypothetical protein
MKLRWLIILPLVSWASYEVGYWHNGYVVRQFWKEMERQRVEPSPAQLFPAAHPHQRLKLSIIHRPERLITGA